MYIFTENRRKPDISCQTGACFSGKLFATAYTWKIQLKQLAKTFQLNVGATNAAGGPSGSKGGTLTGVWRQGPLTPLPPTKLRFTHTINLRKH